jgi:DNA-binding protein HU-beta
MTYAEFVEAVAQHAAAKRGRRSGNRTVMRRLQRADAEAVLEAAFALVVDYVTRGDAVHVPGLGVFKPTSRAPRTVRNPATGELMRLPRTSSIRLSAAKAVRSRQ